MKKVAVKIAPGVLVESVGSEIVVIVPSSTEAIRLTGPAANVMRDVMSGAHVVADDPIVRELSASGVLEVLGLSRRGLITAGAVGAGAGIAVLAMPGVASASSSFIFEGNGGWYWEWSDNEQLQLNFYVEPGFVAGSIGALVISEVIPTPTGASLTAPQTISLDSFAADYVAWRVGGLDDTGVDTNTLSGVYSDLTGTFTVNGQGTFTATFENENSL